MRAEGLSGSVGKGICQIPAMMKHRHVAQALAARPFKPPPAPSHSFNALPEPEPSWCGGEMALVMPAVEGDICGDNVLYRGEIEEGGLCSPKMSII